MSRVHIEMEGVGIFGQQGFGPFAQLVRVLPSVFGSYLQRRLLAREWIGRHIAELCSSDLLGQPACPSRNGAISVACFFGAHGGQCGLELRRLFRAHCRECGAGAH
ncbi:hypothetical protein D3C80_1479300 [compost metagenome]